MSNWIKWNAGVCPVSKNTLVDLVFDDGPIPETSVKAGDYDWENKSEPILLAYRVCEVDNLQSRVNDANFDTVQRPAHYNQSGIECIDAIAAAVKGKSGIEAACVANVIKYLWRYELKNGVEDVRKAQWYLDRLVKELSK